MLLQVTTLLHPFGAVPLRPRTQLVVVHMKYDK